MKATIQAETKHYLLCPACGQRRSAIDHLKIGNSFGPWSCDNPECRTEIRGTVAEDGADIEVVGRAAVPHFALLKFRDLYLVLSDQISGDVDYFYHSHQCPTNLLKRVGKVVDATGSDPHGTMRFVANVPWSEETEERLLSANSLQDLFLLFQTDGQPPPTEWPEENGGVLGFIAEARREYQKSKSPKV